MQIRCPHCHNPVEILDDSSLRDISCSHCGSDFNLVSNETLSFRTEELQLGRFELKAKIGVGAFGTVWKAHDAELDRMVAIKVPRKDQLSERDTEQFLREARAAAQLNHPNIVSVHEIGRHEGVVFIVSDYVQGVTLADWLTGHQPSIDGAIKIISKVSQALHFAHDNGIIHRDLKPSNIMLDADNEPCVMDFGLAKRETGEITMTMDGQILGTPAYMSPEQARGDAHTADRRADIYALGVILFELVTGEKPFRGNTRMLLHQLLNEEAPGPRSLNSGVPRDLDTVVLRCLEKDPSRRFQTATELSSDLERILNRQPVKSRPIGRVQRGARWCRRNPLVASLTATIAATVLIGFGAVTALWITAEENAQESRSFSEKYRKEASHANDLLSKFRSVVSNSVAAHYYFDRFGIEGPLTAPMVPPVEEVIREVWQGHLMDSDLFGPVDTFAIGPQSQLPTFMGNELVHQLLIPQSKDDSSSQLILSRDGWREDEKFTNPIVAAGFVSRRELLTVDTDGGVSVFDYTAGYDDGVNDTIPFPAPLRSARTAPNVTAASLTNDNEHLAIGTRTGKIQVVVTADLTTTRERAESQPVLAIAMNGSTVVSSHDLVGEKSTIRIWNIDDDTSKVLQAQHVGPVTSLALNSKQQLATGGYDNVVRVYDLNVGELVAEFRGHESWVTAVAWDASGRYVASGSGDGRLILWSVEAKAAANTFLHGHATMITKVEFFPTGATDDKLRLVSSSLDHTVRVWAAFFSGYRTIRSIL